MGQLTVVTQLIKPDSLSLGIEALFNLFLQTFFLLHEEGFFVGASSGLNVAAAVKV